MSKQWGHGFHSGQVDAMKRASEAVKRLQDTDAYAMATLHRVLMTHPDSDLVGEMHQAIRQSSFSRTYYQGLWFGSDAGLFVETHPPMGRKAAAQALFDLASRHGWNG